MTISNQQKNILKIIRYRNIPGYFPKMRQAGMVVSVALHVKAIDQQALQISHQEFSQLIPNYQANFDELNALSELPLLPLRQLFAACLGMLVMAGFPKFENIVIDDQVSSEHHVKSLMMPALSMGFSANQLALNWLAMRINLAHNRVQLKKNLKNVASPELQTELRDLIQQMAVYAPIGQNSLRFIQAAQQLDIPYVRVNANVFQFGWGKHARWLDSSFTDVTPNISTRIARNKVATSRLLRSVGIPVCQQVIVKSPDDAVEHAAKMQFPVVIKPADQDGGRGVFVGLKNSAEVRHAYSEAKKLSNTILLEQQFIGNDYRIQIYQGKVYWAVHRIPGGVVGDGVHTVKELLDILNANPTRGEPGSNALLKRIYINQEAQALLDEQGLAMHSVPVEGQYVRLRQAANVASGGSIVPVLETAHPDNLRLAERAARIMRLDLAGIDLLIPDIRRSWFETGAAICEVNAQPQMSPHLPLEILGKLVKNQGLIPVIIVLGHIADENWSEKLQEEVNLLSPQHPLTIGTIDSSACKMAGETMMMAPIDPYTSGLGLLSDPAVDAIVLNFSDKQFLNSGMVVDRISHLFLLSDLCDPSDQLSDQDALDLDGLLFAARFLTQLRVEKISVSSHLQNQVSSIILSENAAPEFFDGDFITELSGALLWQIQMNSNKR